MQKFLFVLAAVCLLAAPASAQKFFSRDAKVKFHSDSKMEKIEAVNKSGTVVLDAATGKMDFKVLIQNFLFEKALMQEHFNENYLESDKYPNATFKGQISNLNEVNFSKDGAYKVNVSGKMNLHGVEKDITVPGTVTVGGGAVKLSAEFSLKCSDYNIKIEAQKAANISNDIKIWVDASLAPLK